MYLNMRRNTQDEFLNFPYIIDQVFIQIILMSVIRHKKLNLHFICLFVLDFAYLLSYWNSFTVAIKRTRSIYAIV